MTGSAISTSTSAGKPLASKSQSQSQTAGDLGSSNDPAASASLSVVTQDDLLEDEPTSTTSGADPVLEEKLKKQQEVDRLRTGAELEPVPTACALASPSKHDEIEN